MAHNDRHPAVLRQPALRQVAGLFLASALLPLPLGCGGELGPVEDEAHADHGPEFVAETSDEQGSLLDQLTPADDGWSVTPTLKQEEAFRRVGIRFDAASVVDIEGRFSDDKGETWSDWAPVTLTYNERIAHNAHLDAPFPATWAELRFRAPVEAELTFAAVELVEYFARSEPEGEGAFDVEAAGESEQGLAADGVVVTRSQWGARSRNCGSWHSPNRLTIHHTVTPNNDSMSMAARMRQIQAYHIDTRGWCDIGYHFLIGQDGQVYQGRYENRTGAHAAGANTHNVGISFIGNYQNTNPSSAMMEAAGRIMDAMVEEYGITRARSRIKGHREVGSTSTSCPGNILFGRLDELISLSATVDGAPVPPPEGDDTPDTDTPAPGCYSSTLDQGVDHGACVQVTYAGCGLGSCGWYHCNAGTWQCINRESCSDTASYPNDGCEAPEPEPEPDPDPSTCYSSTLGESVSGGTCVQVTYAGCGQDGCQWYRCSSDGLWQCTDRGSCDDDLARPNAGCSAAEPEPTPPDVNPSYADVPASHWAFEAIEALRDEGAMWGCAAGQFCPDQPVTRAEVAYLFHQLWDGSVNIPISPIFNDVDTTEWMFDAVQEMSVREITYGCGGGNFCPWEPVTRAAAAVFLRRAEQMSYSAPATPTFVDVDPEHWAYESIETMADAGFVYGCSTSPAKYCPGDLLTRAQAAALFGRAYLNLD